MSVGGCFGDPRSPGGYAAHGEFSMPAVFLSDGGVDYSNPFDPLSGADVEDATVTAINETTGLEVPLPWTEPTGNIQRGSYGGYQVDFAHLAGDDVSIRIEVGDDTIEGSPTETPNSIVTIVQPAHMSTASLPLEIGWTAELGSFPATHVFVFMNSDTTGAAFMDVVPINQGSYTINAEQIPEPSGSHRITVWPTNLMPLSGAQGAVHVKSTEISFTHQVTVM
jgi:hypothetical protein